MCKTHTQATKVEAFNVCLLQGVGIEFWKVTKAMKVTVLPFFPFIKLEDRASYNLVSFITLPIGIHMHNSTQLQFCIFALQQEGV